MSSEAFTTAMFLIAAIIAAGVLINAIFPVIYTLAGTISSSSHTVDERLSNDVKIVTTYAAGDSARIWIKNVGVSRIPPSEIGKADVFLGKSGDFIRLNLAPGSSPGTNEWTYTIHEGIHKNDCWDPGETLYIDARCNNIPGEGGVVYFQFVLSTGLSRSTTFTAGAPP